MGTKFITSTIMDLVWEESISKVYTLLLIRALLPYKVYVAEIQWGYKYRHKDGSVKQKGPIRKINIQMR